jgi:hypothetical protein
MSPIPAVDTVGISVAGERETGADLLESAQSDIDQWQRKLDASLIKPMP